MTYTEEEAKKKFCPFDATSDGMCGGSKCMGWKWDTKATVWESTPGSSADRVVTEGTGHCGCVGVPK